MVSGLHTSVTFMPCSQQSSGGFLTLRISFSSVAQSDFVLYITVVPLFTANYSLPVPKIGSLRKVLSGFRKDEQVVVLEVISSVSYTQKLYTKVTLCVAHRNQV